MTKESIWERAATIFEETSERSRTYYDQEELATLWLGAYSELWKLERLPEAPYVAKVLAREAGLRFKGYKTQ